jgi:hypothetical protein
LVIRLEASALAGLCSTGTALWSVADLSSSTPASLSSVALAIVEGLGRLAGFRAIFVSIRSDRWRDTSPIQDRIDGKWHFHSECRGLAFLLARIFG